MDKEESLTRTLSLLGPNSLKDPENWQTARGILEGMVANHPDREIRVLAGVVVCLMGEKATPA